MTYMPAFTQPAEYLSSSVTKADAELLRLQSHNGLAKLLPTINHAEKAPVYFSRLEKELLIIESKGFCSYFLIVADYVQWARSNSIAVGPGRGSGPCSLVGFTLGITSIDPVKYKLPFERFVNPERDALPDFDVEFCDQRRAEVTNYLLCKYGTERVAHISSDHRPLPSRLVISDRPLAKITPLQ